MILVLAVYLLGVIPAWVFIARAVHTHHRSHWPSLTWDRGDDLFAFFWGFAVALLWPPLLPALALAKLAPLVMDWFIGADRGVR